jgi:hypothetical protein
MQVSQCCFNIIMPQKFHDRCYISIHAQQVSGKNMPEGMHSVFRSVQ